MLTDDIIMEQVNPMKKILVIEDEYKILDILEEYLTNSGYTVLTSETGRGGLELFEKEDVSLILLDLMLPDTTGEYIVELIRRKSRVPIIIITAKVGEEDMVKGLEYGADDYLTKPFSLKVLVAKIEAVLRRSSEELLPLTQKFIYNEGDLTVDFEKGEVSKKGQPISLTPSELGLLSVLSKRPGRIFSRDELIDLAFSRDFEGYHRAVDSHIKNLRQKIEDNPKKPVYILTVHGIGYKFGGI
jgi:DNA-binding response OmpR family regulator